jgi:hypothetical protein
MAEVRDLARQHTDLAIRRLVEISSKPDRGAAGVAACIALLDRGWGRPAQTLTVKQRGSINMIFSAARGTDPLARPRELPHRPIPPLSLEALALEAEIIDLPPADRS